MLSTLKQKMHQHLSRVFVSRKPLKTTIDLTQLPSGYFKKFGHKHPDKIFYVIWREKMGSGFFSNLSLILCHLKIADEAGMIPVIDFSHFPTLYNEKAKINHTANAWEYYFKQVSPYSLEEVYQSQNVFFSDGKYPQGMSFSITEIAGLTKIHKKYISLQNHVRTARDKYLKTLNFKEKILGVHFRGQEQKYATGHSFPPTEMQMLKYTDQILEKHHLEKIFVVTEDQDYLDLFIEKYGDKVLYTNSFRTRQLNAYNLTPRKNHYYLLGLDILIDSLLLSQCHVLLCGDSNVSEYARFIKNKIRFTYMIDNGINSSNELIARYLYNIKKLLPSSFGGFRSMVRVIQT